MSSLRIFTADAFTDKLFQGNPAAVCVTDDELPSQLMQSIASEMNLSETAFVVRRPDGFGLRWFTPSAEVDLCGHATLASAHILYEEGFLKRNVEAVFHTKFSGVLKTVTEGDSIVMDFPEKMPATTEYNDEVLNAVAPLSPLFIGLAGNHFFVEVEDEDAVRGFVPDFGIISDLPRYGLIITSASSGEYDFVSRFFAPAVGVNEDPVTGSAHCALAPYWSAKTGKKRMKAFQASKRGGVMEVLLKDGRVMLIGQAVTVLKAEIRLR